MLLYVHSTVTITDKKNVGSTHITSYLFYYYYLFLTFGIEFICPNSSFSLVFELNIHLPIVSGLNSMQLLLQYLVPNIVLSNVSFVNNVCFEHGENVGNVTKSSRSRLILTFDFRSCATLWGNLIILKTSKQVSVYAWLTYGRGVNASSMSQINPHSLIKLSER